jgi:hypothetical protein
VMENKLSYLFQSQRVNFKFLSKVFGCVYRSLNMSA